MVLQVLINITANGFRQSKNDYSLFTHGFGSSLVILSAYPNDIILVGFDFSYVNNVQLILSSLSKLNILAPIKYFPGLETARFSRMY